VHNDSLDSVFPYPRVVVFALDSRLSNLIAGFEIHELIRRKFRLRDFTDVTQSVRRDFIVEVSPPRLKLDSDFRKLIPVCLNESDIAYGNVILQNDRTKFRFTPLAVNAVHQIVSGHANSGTHDGRRLLYGMRTVFATKDD